MIFGRLTNIARYAGLSQRFGKAIAYVLANDLAALPVGRYEIDGDDAYIMAQDMPLKKWEDGVWEAHRGYADIQIVLEGEELLGVRDIAGVEIAEAYDPGRDVAFYRQDAPGLAVPVTGGDFLILFPEDLHRPCVRRPEADEGARSRRAVVKVRL